MGGGNSSGIRAAYRTARKEGTSDASSLRRLFVTGAML